MRKFNESLQLDLMTADISLQLKEKFFDLRASADSTLSVASFIKFKSYCCFLMINSST